MTTIVAVKKSGIAAIAADTLTTLATLACLHRWMFRMTRYRIPVTVISA